MPPDAFNSGVMVIDPSEFIMKQILNAQRQTKSLNGGDQGFLNEIFRDWNQLPSLFRLPYQYNVQSKLRHYHTRGWATLSQQIKILHFSPDKPWRDPECKASANGLNELHALWWLVAARAFAQARRQCDDLRKRKQGHDPDHANLCELLRMWKVGATGRPHVRCEATLTRLFG